MVHLTHTHKWNVILPVPIWLVLLFTTETKVENKIQGRYLKDIIFTVKFNAYRVNKTVGFAFLSTQIYNQPKETI